MEISRKDLRDLRDYLFGLEATCCSLSACFSKSNQSVSELFLDNAEAAQYFAHLIRQIEENFENVFCQESIVVDDD